jgi:lysophospholipase L1-like esterase
VVVLGSSGKLDTPNFLQPLRWLVMWRATAVRARQERVARTFDVEFVDVAEEVAPEFARIGPSANSSDDFHPSATGYAAWARPLADRVIAAVGDTD